GRRGVLGRAVLGRPRRWSRHQPRLLVADGGGRALAVRRPGGHSTVFVAALVLSARAALADPPPAPGAPPAGAAARPTGTGARRTVGFIVGGVGAGAALAGGILGVLARNARSTVDAECKSSSPPTSPPTHLCTSIGLDAVSRFAPSGPRPPSRWRSAR